jgi:hypothetical protein
MRLEDFRAALTDELGDAADLIRDEQLDRWVNRGRVRLGLLEAKAVDLTWNDNDSEVLFPDDFVRFDRLIATPTIAIIPQYTVLARSLSFFDPERVTTGSGTLYYGASYEPVSGAVGSTMPAMADEAVVSYALARFFRRIATTRSDFRRYTTVTGQSGIDVADLIDLAERHDADFEAARADLVNAAPAAFYGD